MKNIIVIIFMMILMNLANAGIRIVPRSDYGKGTGLDAYSAPISDRMSSIGKVISGKPLGGDLDLVYQTSTDSSLSQIYQCPSLKACNGNSSCMKEEKYWQCTQVYEGTQKELCRIYTNRMRVQKVMGWIGGEIVGGAVVGQIAFLGHGIGLLFTNVTEVVGDIDTSKNIIKTSCQDLGETPHAVDSAVTIIEEKDKLQVENTLQIFYNPIQPAVVDLVHNPSNDYAKLDYIYVQVKLNPSDLKLSLVNNKKSEKKFSFFSAINNGALKKKEMDPMDMARRSILGSALNK
jgi:hypothetical protein